MARVHEVDSPTTVESGTNIIARIIYIIAGIIIGLLGIRFVLVLLGASRGSGFVDFIYDVTTPLAAPFFGMFNYDPIDGASRLEFETLIAIVVYSLVAWVLIRLVTIGNRHVDV